MSRRSRRAPLALAAALLVVPAGMALSTASAASPTTARTVAATTGTATSSATTTPTTKKEKRAARKAARQAAKSTTTTPTTTPTTEATTSTLKAPIVGLLDRQKAPTAPQNAHVRAFVVDASWASLQPQQGGAITHPNDIDRAIDVARANGYTLKLRVRAGIDAPEWAKKLDGAPVPMTYTAATVKKAGTSAGTIGRFWTPKFGVAYDDLQTKLAAAYDGVPEIRQTDITRCSTIFSETYLRNTKDAANAKALLSAGFTRAADDLCHSQQVASHRVWKRTLSNLAMNPYQAISADGSVKKDLAYTLAEMKACRQVLADRCVLENRSVSSSRLKDSDYTAIYAEMKRLGGTFGFQTATAAKIGDYNAVLTWAANFGAASIELPAGYQDWPLSTIQSASASFAK
jgi:hypothetical protein